MARHSSRKPVGRYDGQSKGVFVPPDLPTQGKSLAGKREVVHANVQDPKEADKRSRAAINRANVLEMQRSRGFISEAAYRLGQQIEKAFETIRVGGGGQWRDGSRVDAKSAQEQMIVWGLDDARHAMWTFQWMEHHLSEINLRILIRVLREGQTFAQVTRQITSAGRWQIAEVAFRFRDALETLAEKRIGLQEFIDDARDRHRAAQDMARRERGLVRY